MEIMCIILENCGWARTTDQKKTAQRNICNTNVHVAALYSVVLSLSLSHTHIFITRILFIFDVSMAIAISTNSPISPISLLSIIIIQPASTFKNVLLLDVFTSNSKIVSDMHN